MKQKRAQTLPLNKLAGWIIALFILVLLVFSALIISGKLDGFADFLKNLLRFRR